MRVHPIIFSTNMILAILDGRKTQTRRVIKPPPKGEFTGLYAVQVSPLKFETSFTWRDPHSHELTAFKSCPYGIRGDQLWVRETFYKPSDALDKVVYKYKADANKIYLAGFKLAGTKWTPSIFMPRWASRITLEIADVRVERVQENSTVDAIAEGWPGLQEPATFDSATEWFCALWDSLNAKRGYGWDVNPWVWVIEFRRLAAS